MCVHVCCVCVCARVCVRVYVCVTFINPLYPTYSYRYLAVCHPVTSIGYRTPFVSRVVCACVWIASMLAMLPMMLYATTMPHAALPGRETCTIRWPHGQAIHPDAAFIWYAFLLGFAIPVGLISVFYTLVVLRLKTVGPAAAAVVASAADRAARRAAAAAGATIAVATAAGAGAASKRSGGGGGRGGTSSRGRVSRVTTLVLTVTAVYICCWLPYWVFQVSYLRAAGCSTGCSR